MTATKECFDLIRAFEGLSLTSYPDPGNFNGLPVTIGYGSTMKKDGTRFKLCETITIEQAEELLEWEVHNKSVVVDSLTSKYKLNQNQFNALTSLVFNIGAGNFANSTLLKKLKRDSTDPTIPDEFLRWNKVGKKVLKGLTRRREAERKLFMKKN